MQRYESRHQARARCTSGDLKPDHGPDPHDAAEWFGCDPNSEEYERQRLDEEEEVLFLAAIADGEAESARASRLIACPSYFSEQTDLFETDPELSRSAALLVALDRTAIEQIAGTAA
ncbi:MAG TPA: hypothetical protein VFW52_01815 [Candidatus Saccharimonadales bacterium]|nr:hypothetical protein [Candidatus Saccharimonadales bacterium]